MRRMLLLTVVLGLLACAVPALAGDGATVDRAADCWFPGIGSGLYEAHDLRVQKVKNPADRGQFHCHGMIDDTSQAPAKAVVLSGGECYLPIWFGWQPGVGNGVVTPDGHINITCHFSP